MMMMNCRGAAATLSCAKSAQSLKCPHPRRVDACLAPETRDFELVASNVGRPRHGFQPARAGDNTPVCAWQTFAQQSCGCELTVNTIKADWRWRCVVLSEFTCGGTERVRIQRYKHTTVLCTEYEYRTHGAEYTTHGACGFIDLEARDSAAVA